MAELEDLRAFLLCLQMFVLMQKQAMSIQKQQLMRKRRRRLRARTMALLNITRRRGVWTYPRAQLWWDVTVPEMTDEEFLRNFRVSRESFSYICRSLAPILQKKNTNCRLCLPVDKRVAVALWKLATNTEYRSVSNLFGVGIATVCHCLQDFCNAVIKVLLPEHIKTPDSQKLVEMAAVFKNRWGAPQCVGAIDCSHIPIIAPTEYPRDYFNRKGWHSIILQAVVDGRGLFWDVCVGYPGSVHDARVLKQSKLWELLSDGQLFSQNTVNITGHNVGQYLIGDPAYPMKTWLMKPFSDTGLLTQQQQQYNARLSSAWSVVETAFVRLKGRWRCLLKRNDCSLDLTKKMVMTCSVLHNICEANGDQYIDDDTETHVNVQPPVRVLQEGQQLEGTDVRAALLDYFNSD
ncbi:protein ANTAGONIST OF LIKE HETEROCHROMATIN PROTEIN 1 isoform X1 [Girardinichthys multiradiatus]|uniref:protein ANTAGONIST OF LIKE HETEROCHROMATIN PROTEIN 1 isoform X1 n=1 Tax=Girardinichthys multiradiatus TaxID=208333 RepID=UPI001FADA33C|nr:protein ANTAGONIST OF LIKE HETEROCHROMATIN PROTEIN 1 isoform X1 [Girardinichthys multiradiatus]